MQTNLDVAAERTREDLLGRNRVVTEFFTAEAPRLARACHEMSQRFMAGGRLLAFGTGTASTDAQHVSVEFVHPVIVGKRALPAIDLGAGWSERLPVVLGPSDMVMAFSTDGEDAAIRQTLRDARARGALTFMLCGGEGDYAFSTPDPDPLIAQEIAEILYHLLWETVHVFFEHREQGHDIGASSFLYPFLGRDQQPLEGVIEEVQESMLRKAAEVNDIRAALAETETETITAIARAMLPRLRSGGTIITFGNGGSATDANDLAADCIAPPTGLRAVPALSLASEPANITAVANDIGSEEIFARQLEAHSRPADIAVAISTSGSSPNIIAGLAEARKRGLLTVALAGYDGGRVLAERLADHVIVVRSDHIPRIQEVQASAYHVLLLRLNEEWDGS